MKSQFSFSEDDANYLLIALSLSVVQFYPGNNATSSFKFHLSQGNKMRLFQGLFIYAMFVNKSEEKNDKDASCFNFGELGHSRLKGPSNMGSEYAVVNLTHSYRFYSLDTGFSERIVVTNISFLFESGMKRVMDLYAEGEVADGNPRKLAVAFDGTLLEAAIGEHEMFYVPSYNITSDEWECWNWSKPLPLDK